MLRIVTSELCKFGQSFLDEMQDIDWGDEPDPRQLPPTGRISPDNPPGVVNEENFEQYEPSQAEKEQYLQDLNPDQNDTFEEPLDYQQEIPTQNELLGIPENTQEILYDNKNGMTTDQLLDDGMQQNEVISFDYTNRFGQYAGTRTVEPHYTFIAQTTGNEILVTFDRDQNDIRAFIVGNIHPFGVRYKDVKFQPRGEIMRSIG